MQFLVIIWPVIFFILKICQRSVITHARGTQYHSNTMPTYLNLLFVQALIIAFISVLVFRLFILIFSTKSKVLISHFLTAWRVFPVIFINNCMHVVLMSSAFLVPDEFTRTTKLAIRSHVFNVELDLDKFNHNFYSNNLISQISRLYNALPYYCDPANDGIRKFKYNTNSSLVSP